MAKGDTKPPVDKTDYNVDYEFQLNVLNLSEMSAQLIFDNGLTYGGSPFAPYMVRVTVNFRTAPVYYGATLVVNVPGYKEFRERLLINVTLTSHHQVIDLGDFELESVVKPSVLTPLVIEGEFFRDIFLSQASAFKDLMNYCTDIDITTSLKQYQDAGINCRRVFGMAKNLFVFDPDHYDKYFEWLVEYCFLAEQYKQYVNFVAFPDVHLLHDDFGWQRDFLIQVNETIKQAGVRNFIGSLQNELDQIPNQMQWERFTKPEGLIWSRGSFGGSAVIPPRPWWDYEEVHLNGQSEWQRKTHNAMECSRGTDGIQASRVPIIVSETTRCPDQDNNNYHWFDYGASGALLCAGVCFHSVAGKVSAPLSSAELYQITQFTSGVASVSLRDRAGAYGRPDELLVKDQPNPRDNDLRVYSKTLGNNRTIVHVRQG